VRAALAELGIEPAPDDDLRWIVGPPLGPSFAKLLGGVDRVEHAIGVYRRHYSEWGLLACKPYPGMVAELHRLRDADHTLFVCTSKLTSFAKRLVDHFAVGTLFAGVHGTELGGDGESKVALVARILKQRGLDKRHCCMIGDRREDVRAGRDNQIATIGVLWGYGDLDELVAAGATAVCDAPGNLGALVRGFIDSRPEHPSKEANQS
jgi:phosphoglycolate phosphatase